LRHLLSTLFDIPTLAAASPMEVEWAALPPGCVLQVHWHPTPLFHAWLEQYGFRVVVLTRHPFDVLVSILHFALHNSTGRWLEGEEGNERSIFGAMPRSTAFIEYATGKRAAALLSISRQWWQAPGGHRLRYEDLTSDPYRELTRLAEEVGGAARVSVADAVAANSMSALRIRSRNYTHFWKGEPGLWRRLLPTAEAQAIAQVLAGSLEEFGYRCDPDPLLEGGQADANWIQLVWAELAEHLHDIDKTRWDLSATRQALAQAQHDLEATRHDFDRTQQEMGAARDALDRTQQELAACRQTLEQVQQESGSARQALTQSQHDLGATRQALEECRQEANATRQTLAQTQNDLRASQHDLSATLKTLNTIQWQYATSQEALQLARREQQEILERLQATERALNQETLQLEEARAHLIRFEELGPALALARKLRAASERHPHLAALVRRVISPAA
jgi:hypothetical protein